MEIIIYILVRAYIPGDAIIKDLPQQRQLAVVNDNLEKRRSIVQLATVYLKPFINYVHNCFTRQVVPSEEGNNLSIMNQNVDRIRIQCSKQGR